MEQGCELPATKPHTPSEWELDPGLAERPGMDLTPGMEAGEAGEELGLSGKCPHNQAWLCCRQEQEEEEEGTCLTAAGQWRLLEPPSLPGRVGISRCPLPSRSRGALVRERGPGGGQESSELRWRGAAEGRDPLSSCPAGLGIGSCGAAEDRALPEEGRGYRRDGEAGAKGSSSARSGVGGHAGKGL